MNPETRPAEVPRAVAREAALWVVRHERGLTPAEQDAFSQWLAADPRHGEALRGRRWAWREFDRIAGLPAVVPAAPDPDLLAPRGIFSFRRQPRWLARSLALAAAAVIACVIWIPADHSSDAEPARALSTALAAPCERLVLDDGSVVELNRGARLTVDFSPGLRRVRLERGEAHFVVSKDSARPFVVDAAGVTARAVGTAFNVRLAAASVEVVVTEGRVAFGRGADGPGATEARLLEARQRAVLPLDQAAPTAPIANLTETDLAQHLAWQPKFLDFSDAPLGEVVATLNQRNPVQLILAAPALRALRINATIRSDNIEGFVRLLESAFDLRAEWRNETEIAFRPGR
ncbi:MAG: FecR domain-containing protein [Opitutaceae bacterium]|nr:FecR domain-containing protein [Opitutaceae bacterium]